MECRSGKSDGNEKTPADTQYTLVFLWLLRVLAKGVRRFGLRALGKSEHAILHPEEEQPKLFEGTA